MNELKKNRVSNKILVIDDDSSIFESLKKLTFEIQSISFVGAYDGYDAIQKLKDIDPAVILLDMILPGKNGLELMEIIQEDKRFKDLHIIVYSNLDNPEKIHQAYKRGVDGYYLKSDYSISDILKIIYQYLH